jgi:alkylation response protein AidB-like acyl-CoA dehydrogenase
MSEFFQSGPQLSNTFAMDEGLKQCLQQYVSEDLWQSVVPQFQQLGERAAFEMPALAKSCEQQPPRHIPFDPWGRRIDKIEVHQAWDQLKAIAAEEGIVATGYERNYGDRSRLVQMTLLYLYHPSSAIFSCPLAMTDGAARAIELYGDQDLKSGAFKALTSRNPKAFWTSGQWMTERTGGSDVRLSQTAAIARGDEWQLFGTKWFTSATTSEMAMTLARPTGETDLSLFYLEMRDGNGNLNHMNIHRLKDKLGTRALPTAELTLDGTRARMVGEQGNGIRKISSLFNITRIYNAVCAISSMRRAIDLAKDYAHRRKAFGKKIIDLPLHLRTLTDLELRMRGCLHLVFYVADLLGKDECGTDPEAAPILRLLTPVTKLFTAKEAIAGVSECLEAFGGAGYVEDTGLPVMLRDVQVLSIWEGTTNVLSLDLLRAMTREAAFEPFLATMHQRLEQIESGQLVSDKERLSGLLNKLKIAGIELARGGPEAAQMRARDFAFFVAHATISTLLLSHADWHIRRDHSGANAALLCAKWQIERCATVAREGQHLSLDDMRDILNPTSATCSSNS